MRNTRSARRSSRHSKLLHTCTCTLRFLHQPRYSRGGPNTLHAAGSPPSTAQASCSTRTRRQATLSLRSSPPRGAATAAGAAAATAYMATRMSSRKGGWRCAAPSPARLGGDGASVETDGCSGRDVALRGGCRRRVGGTDTAHTVCECLIVSCNATTRAYIVYGVWTVS